MNKINYNLKNLNIYESYIDTVFPMFQDDVYTQIVSQRISLEDFEGAIHTASKIKIRSSQDKALFDIISKSHDQNIAEKAADKINVWENRDNAYLKILEKRVLHTDIKGAIHTISKIKILANQNLARSIFKKYTFENSKSITFKINRHPFCD